MPWVKPWFFYFSLLIQGGVIVKRVFTYVWRYKLLLIIPSIAMILSIALDMFNPYLQKVMIDKVILKSDLGLLIPLLLGIGAITILRAIFGYVKEYLFDYLSTKINIDLKKELFDHIQSLSYSYFDGMNTGELMSRIGEDIDNIWRTISFGLRLFVENAIYFISASFVLFYLDWKLALICISIMLPIAYLAMKLEKKVDDAYGKISDQAAVINTTAQENIAGVRLVKAFAREKYEILKFLELNNQNYKLNMEQNNVIAKYFPAIEFLTNIAIVFMISLGGVYVIKDDISVGTLVAFNGYIWMLIWPMRMLGWLTNMLAQNNASAKKIFKILNTEPDIKDNDFSVSLECMKGTIEFKNVSFKYNDEYVLKNINLKAKPGSTIAIMGTTGSGKTSIVNLIGRFYDTTEGAVLIDGYDIKDIYLKDLRSRLAVVSQDTFLFSQTIEENIKHGKKDASMEDILRASKASCADEFIQGFDEGYNTLIGERGIGLSGGQKQRISIARALIRDSKILILDDATSALDMETEYNLLKNLNNRENKPTTFIIAHRISAVKNADEIVYLDNGVIVERGTHEELIKKRGRYYSVYCDQFKDFEDVEGEVI